jgi:hypothetical protein
MSQKKAVISQWEMDGHVLGVFSFVQIFATHTRLSLATTFIHCARGQHYNHSLSGYRHLVKSRRHHSLSCRCRIMADLEDKGTFSEHYPAPPPFWRKFTEANLASLKDIRETGEEVPEELRALVPPPAPTDGKYRSFGANWNVCCQE